MTPRLDVIQRYEPRLERPGEQHALLRGVVFSVGERHTAWVITAWDRWIRVGDYPSASDGWRRLHEIDQQLESWQSRGGRAFCEHSTTPLIWLMLEWTAIDLDVFNTLWGVPACF